MSIENIKELMDGFELEKLLPEITSILDLVVPIARILMLLGPYVLLGLGLYYFLAAPKEANYRSGYRCHWGMGSVEAWRFTQKVAGGVFVLLGLGLAIAMAVFSTGLAQLELMDLLLQVALYLILQMLVALAGTWIINLIVICRYDAKGNRRYTWAELWRG